MRIATARLWAEVAALSPWTTAEEHARLAQAHRQLAGVHEQMARLKRPTFPAWVNPYDDEAFGDG